MTLWDELDEYFKNHQKLRKEILEKTNKMLGSIYFKETLLPQLTIITNQIMKDVEHATIQHVADYFARRRELRADAWVLITQKLCEEEDTPEEEINNIIKQKITQVYGPYGVYLEYLLKGYESSLRESLAYVENWADERLKHLDKAEKEEKRKKQDENWKKYLEKKKYENLEDMVDENESKPEQRRKKKTIGLGKRIYNFFFHRNKDKRD